MAISTSLDSSGFERDHQSPSSPETQPLLQPTKSIPLRGAPPRTRLVRANTRAATDISVLGKLKDTEYIQEHYPKLDHGEVTMAAEALEKVVAVCEHTGGVGSRGVKDLSFSTEFRNAMMFKNRPTKSATLLHFAVWFVAEFGVDADLIQLVIESLGDPDEVFLPACYRAGPKTVFVTAVHIAAGLGQLDILKILTRHVWSAASEEKKMTPHDYVNQWAQITPADSYLTGQDYLKEDEELTHFYQPIHESTFTGYGDVTLWLLQQKAECTRNVQNITPLHFLAFMGLSGVLEKRLGSEMRLIVHALTESGRKGENVRATANMVSFIPDATNVTPLEIAVEDSSRFPQDHLGLLAPCLSEGTELTYFQDIKRIADVTADGALNLVRTIAEKGKKHQTVLRRFRINAQQDGMSDILASIFYTAPLAASEMLDLLEVQPEVEDAAHHSVPTRTGMWGLLKNVPMRCTYQDEAINKDCLMIPHWEWKTREAGTQDGWHSEFIPRPARQDRSGHIKSVKTVVCLLPNILDIDVFMAFSHCRKEHFQTMSKKTVQGSIFCLWANLIEHVWLVDISYHFAEAWAYLALGILIPSHEARNSLAWTIVAGGALHQLMHITFAAGSAYHKWKNTDDPTMKSMWSPTARWSLSFLIPNLIQVFCALGFSIDLSYQYGERSRFDDRLLALCLMLACCRFIWQWRLSVIGSTIYTISETFFAGAVSQMLFITCMLLLSTVMSLMVLSRHHTLGLAISAYRGFLFGDDHAFDDLGMDIGHERAFASDDNVLLFSSVAGAFFFNIIVLNIIIAIYGHEYEKNQANTPAQFMIGRADFCVKSILSSYVIPWKGVRFNQFLRCTAVILIMTSIVIGATRSLGSFWLMWLSATLFAVGHKMLSMSMIQCDWFSPEGQDSSDNHRFLWICHSREWNTMPETEESNVEEKITTLQDIVEDNMSTMQDQLAELDGKIGDIFEAFSKKMGAPPTPKTPRTQAYHRTAISQ